MIKILPADRSYAEYGEMLISYLTKIFYDDFNVHGYLVGFQMANLVSRGHMQSFHHVSSLAHDPKPQIHLETNHV